MRPVLRPGSLVLRRDRDRLQAGTGPRDAHQFRDAPGLVPLLRTLDGVRDVAMIEAEAPGLRRGVAGTLLGELAEAGVLVDASAWDQAPSDLRAEAAHLACLGLGVEEGRRRLAARAAARVEVSAASQLGGLGDAVIELLGRSGVVARAERTDQPSVVVVLADRPPVRAPFEVLVADGLPHLPVVLEHARARVGPFVVPGVSPCVACDDLTRAAADPAWGAVVAQLDQPLVAPAEQGPDGLSAVTAALVAAVVADEVLTHLDGGRPTTWGRAVVLGPRAQDSRTETVRRSRGCRCHHRPAAATRPRPSANRRNGRDLVGPPSGEAGTMTV